MNSAASSKELSFTFRRAVEQEVKVSITQDTNAVLRDMLVQLEPDKVFLISDSNVGKLYAEPIRKDLQGELPIFHLVHNPDEAQKNLQQIDRLSEEFFANGGSSKSCVVALGGGITGNMAGLFASLAFRGLPLIHIPTTLLSQVDSAADVKQSVNAGHLKNSLGMYKAPHAVIINPDYLLSLSDRELRAGIGEAIKHGFAQDLNFVEDIAASNFRDVAVLSSVSATAIRLKIEHWQHTPTIWNDKTKVERLTHLGQTVGKVLEMVDVDYLTHGEAIAHGMSIEAYASHFAGYLDQNSIKYMQEKLNKVGLFYPLNKHYSTEAIVKGLYPQTDSHPIFALLKELGNPDTTSTTLSLSILEQAITAHLKFLKAEGLYT